MGPENLCNRGVELIDGDLMEDARALFVQALAQDPLHFPSTYNLNLIDWRSARSSCEQVWRNLDHVRRCSAAGPEAAYMMSLVAIESGDARLARQMVDEALSQDPPGGLRRRLQECRTSLSPGIESLWRRDLEAIERLADDLPYARPRATRASSEPCRIVTHETPSSLVVIDGRAGETLATLHGTEFDTALTSDRLVTSTGSALHLWSGDGRRHLREIPCQQWVGYSIAVSQDGTSAATACPPSSVYTWDLEAGALLKSVVVVDANWSHEMPEPLTVAISPDGRRVLATESHVARISDVRTGKVLVDIAAHMWCWTPGLALGVGRRGEAPLALWDLTTGEKLDTIEGHTMAIGACGISPDGSRLLTWGFDHAFRLWDRSSGELVCIKAFEGYTEDVRQLVLVPGGRYALSRGETGALRVWDLGTGRRIGVVDGTVLSIVHVEPREGSIDIVVERADALERLRVRLDRPKAPWLRCPEGGSPGPVTASGGARNGADAVEETVSPRADRQQSPTGWLVALNRAHVRRVMAVRVTPDEQQVVSLGGEGILVVTDIASGAEVRRIPVDLRPPQNRDTDVVDVALGYGIALSVAGCGNMVVWDMATGKSRQGKSGFRSCVAMTPDRRRMLTGACENIVEVWDIARGRMVGELQGHEEEVWSVAITPDGKTGLSGSQDGTVRVWSIPTMSPASTLVGHGQAVLGIAVSRDGLRAVSCSLDKTVRLWDLRGRSELWAEECTSAVTAVEISGDGKWVFSGEAAGTITIWNADDPGERATLIGHADAVTSLAFAQGSGRLASGGVDRRLRIWQLRLERAERPRIHPRH
jgi:WD40 repeat protein